MAVNSLALTILFIRKYLQTKLISFFKIKLKEKKDTYRKNKTLVGFQLFSYLPVLRNCPFAASTVKAI